MKFNTLVPNVFYSDINHGLKIFVNCLGFDIEYDDLKSERPFCIIKRDVLKLHLVQDEEFAIKDRPEIRMETDDIEAVYQLVNTNAPELLHPNANKISERPWGSKEFAMRDDSGVCVIIEQL
jgi:hypothetical protein